MSRKNIFIICLLASLITSIVMSFLANRIIFFAYHQPEDFGCMAELRLYTEPTTRTIKIQDSFRASIVLEDCLGSLKLSEHVTWVSGNPNIVEVEPETGIVTAISNGETYVRPVGKVYGNLKAIQVIVSE